MQIQSINLINCIKKPKYTTNNIQKQNNTVSFTSSKETSEYLQKAKEIQEEVSKIKSNSIELQKKSAQIQDFVFMTENRAKKLLNSLQSQIQMTDDEDVYDINGEIYHIKKDENELTLTEFKETQDGIKYKKYFYNDKNELTKYEEGITQPDDETAITDKGFEKKPSQHGMTLKNYYEGKRQDSNAATIVHRFNYSPYGLYSYENSIYETDRGSRVKNEYKFIQNQLNVGVDVRSKRLYDGSFERNYAKKYIFNSGILKNYIENGKGLKSNYIYSFYSEGMLKSVEKSFVTTTFTEFDKSGNVISPIDNNNI